YLLNRPTTSQPETSPLHHQINDIDLYRAEWQGRQYLANNNGEEHNENVTNACMDYMDWCPEGVINMISSWY
ncbi:uncharacterized protein LOC124421241, partial [Lucilia cuprina]|uniref:uncharacterized protein LOC124421241 n=1 Tax=Lucilia cuprina TaxID=7375 RepID=UPI001F0670E6